MNLLKLKMNELRVNDVLVDPEWAGMWGRKILAIHIHEDTLTPTHGRVVSIQLAGHAGITSRENKELEVLRRDA